jgi:CRAL/TRIO domain
VFDIGGMSIKQINSDFLELARTLSAEVAPQYPDTGGTIFIINAPSAFPIAWSLIKKLIDPKAVSPSPRKAPRICDYIINLWTHVFQVDCYVL